MDGYRTMWTGFGRSVNTFFVWLETQLKDGPQDAVNMAKALGIQFEGDPDQAYTGDTSASDAWLANHASEWGAFTLGVASTFPLELANAYATVAAQGTYCSPTPVLSVTDPAGKTLKSGDFANCHQVQYKDATTGRTTTVSPDVFRAAADAARCPVGQQSAYGKCDGGTDDAVSDEMHGRPIAGKTGTSENESTESFAGFTPTVAGAGTAVDPTNPQDYVTSGVSPQVDKAVVAAMYAYDQRHAAKDFTKPPATIAYGASGRDTGTPSTKATPSSNTGPTAAFTADSAVLTSRRRR
jgi:membrane peptidoglycan carboxypeptidase